VKYAFIQSHSQCHTITRLCQVLGVSCSSYYAWRNRPENDRTQENHRLTSKIAYFHQASRGTYGSPRIYQDLLASGEQVGVNRVARLMRQTGIASKMTQHFVMTTGSKHTLTPAPDRLQRRFRTAHENTACKKPGQRAIFSIIRNNCSLAPILPKEQ